MGMFAEIPIALLIPALVPLAVLITAPFVRAVQNTRARRRIKSDPMIQNGVILTRIEHPGRDKPIMGRCQIVSIARNWVIVQDA